MESIQTLGDEGAWAGRVEGLVRKGLGVLVGAGEDAVVAAEAKELIGQMEGVLGRGGGDARGCAEAGLWLLAGDLDRAHGICQGIATTYGSAWHAVMHRREGDFSNSKYWWRRAGAVEWGDLAKRMETELAGGPAEALRCVRGGRYDPAAFVDLVEEHAEGEASMREALVKIQRAEWWALFEHCVAAAR